MKFQSFRWNDFKFSIGEHSNITNQINQDPYRFMINFDVNEIDDIIKNLKVKNVEVLRNPEKEHWGGFVATFKDPDGNIIQLLQHP